jgi:hypothetical protein
MTTKVAAGMRALVVIALLASACSSTPAQVTGKASSPRTAFPTPNPSSPAASPSCSLPSNPCLALVTLRGSNQVVVRDVTDISHAKTVDATAQYSQGQFVSAHTRSYVEAGVVFSVPVGGSSRTMANTSQYVTAYAWSPNGDTLAYIANGASGMELHLVRGGVDRKVSGSMPPLPAVGCEVTCPNADVWDLRLLYSPDGSRISFVHSIVKPVFRVWTSDGALLKSFDLQSQSMSVWSGNGLYFRDANGVEVWRDGVISAFMPGVAWIRPKASPGGGQIVYETRDSAGTAHVQLVDTSTKQARELKANRAEPAFLTSRFIWYQGGAKTYIYDLQDGTESESIITSVLDIWPHAA